MQIQNPSTDPAAILFGDGRLTFTGGSWPMEACTEEQFKEAMLNTFHEAAKLGYKPTYFMRMIQELGAVPTAKQLIHEPKFSTGFIKLWELKRLDLSVEALVIQSQWKNWFNETDRNAARDKLAKLGFPTG